ncbi:hypothetical protein K435DRAFT_967432 [Dendrothele bispora CBS 962.96]|uniref:Uncharacterized protein n=1 Tax=Dendrothele bispora (strain CBS 962.96) TaxID=1314807 RepID=A0A4V4HF14_DENBC|nr:hypothetical protein K435DRAFT_967432 [Dendrothele bispora CBS 962.96]
MEVHSSLSSLFNNMFLFLALFTGLLFISTPHAAIKTDIPDVDCARFSPVNVLFTLSLSSHSGPSLDNVRCPQRYSRKRHIQDFTEQNTMHLQGICKMTLGGNYTSYGNLLLSRLSAPALCQYGNLLLSWLGAPTSCHYGNLLLRWLGASALCHYGNLLLPWLGASASCHYGNLLLPWLGASASCHYGNLLLPWLDAPQSCHYGNILLPRLDAPTVCRYENLFDSQSDTTNLIHDENSIFGLDAHIASQNYILFHSEYISMRSTPSSSCPSKTSALTSSPNYEYLTQSDFMALHVLLLVVKLSILHTELFISIPFVQAGPMLILQDL